MIEKPAKTQYPILEALAERWSPRAFADRPVEPENLGSLFEAVRWAASAFNEQPWRFIVATRDNAAEYEKLLSCLVEKNQEWAKGAPVLIITVASKKFAKNGNDNRVHLHDLGLGVGNLCAQATALGLVLHQMAGIELDKARQTFNIPDDFEPVTGIAIGYQGEIDTLSEDWMREAEQSPRARKPFNEFVFTGEFGKPSPLFDA